MSKMYSFFRVASLTVALILVGVTTASGVGPDGTMPRGAEAPDGTMPHSDSGPYGTVPQPHIDVDVNVDAAIAPTKAPSRSPRIAIEDVVVEDAVAAQPPGQVESHQLLRAGDFEGRPDILSSFWRVGDENAWRCPSDRSYAGIGAMRLHAALGPVLPQCSPYAPYLSQTVEIPSQVYTMTTMHVRGRQLVTSGRSECCTGGPDPADVLYLEVRDGDGNVLKDADIANGGAPAKWSAFEVDVTGLVSSHLGEAVQVYFRVEQDGDADCTWFYLDDLECEVRTEWPVPAPISGTISIGGRVQVFVGGVPTEREGVPVQLDDGAGTVLHTATIRDSTYHFYNVPPGSYTIYAETWLGALPGRVLRFDSTVITATADVDDVDLFLH